ncbi:XRE family transcriptional regulator [Kribbella capetownensis]|uniref:XRE family transcriptional regulator n=1 Tax=Kribbella capetownensis TaxID=1572659 RepID=A0A4R0JW82_9ACTN|nr:helix-turn-helix domain-containing protein [Kribbella capetownensis]TCC46545.1 XRE family transcriptional regulator [Kribbella capetownensis]
MTRSQRRLCPSCGAYLAADNGGDQCGPCQRRAPEFTREAPRLSDDFWEADALAEAAVERHFGKLLLAYRKLLRPEPTQAHVGQWLGLTQGQVSRIERSAIPVRDLGKLDRWARTLNIPERLLWFNLTARPVDCGEQADARAPHAQANYDDGQDGIDAYTRSDRRSIVQAQSPAEGDGVHRRQFIKSAGAGLTAVGPVCWPVRRPAPTGASVVYGQTRAPRFAR